MNSADTIYHYHTFLGKKTLVAKIKKLLKSPDVYQTVLFCGFHYKENIISVPLCFSLFPNIKVEDAVKEMLKEVEYRKKEINMKEYGLKDEKITNKEKIYESYLKSGGELLIAFKYSEIGTKPQHLKKEPSYGWYYLDGMFFNEGFEDNYGKTHNLCFKANKNITKYKLKITKEDIYYIFFEQF